MSDGDPQKWNLALNNLRNVADDLGEDAVELELVVYGPGIGMLKADSPVGARVAAALKGGVKVVACENTMKAQKLVSADMLPGIGYVPAGVVELIKKQREGYAYIRP
jgi:intracellular sulfur oxidation DsrE/DsrF family protein